MLKKTDIRFVTEGWIGVKDGYLGDFSYRTHREFYPYYCDTYEINPDEIEGTTRERFIKILKKSKPHIQTKILRGILEKYPVNSSANRTEEKHKIMKKLILKCEGGPSVSSPKPSFSLDVVNRALDDAETFIKNRNPVSAIDRTHTAFHGYLINLCDEFKIEYEKNTSTTRLFKLLRIRLEDSSSKKPFYSEIKKILNALSVIVDSINPIRNRGSIAHPNKDLINSSEAMLYINSIRTLIHYLNEKYSKKE